jgi:hypothetical protein
MGTGQPRTIDLVARMRPARFGGGRLDAVSGPGEPDDRPSGAGEPDDRPSGAGEPDDWAPWWRKLGFGSQQEYLDGLEEHQAQFDRWFPSRTGRDPPAAALPGAEIADLPPRRRRAPVRQVGIKLRPVDYESLARAAFLYGVRPSTLARMLVNRGVRAVLEDRAG